jgi:hypothetical protein
MRRPQRQKVFTKQNGNKLELDPVFLTYRGTQLPYFGLYDVLGWYLSVVGRSPADATTENYFKPVLYLYTVWCYKAAGSASPLPSTTQITWLNAHPAPKPIILTPQLPHTDAELDPDLSIALGASIGATGPIKQTVLRGRYALLDENIPGLPPPHASLVRRGGQNLGHCAETYPILQLLRWVCGKQKRRTGNDDKIFCAFAFLFDSRRTNHLEGGREGFLP